VSSTIGDLQAVRLHTRRVHSCAIPVSLKICTIPIFFCVHPVSVLVKLWWQCINNFPDSGMYIAQVRFHNLHVHVRAVPVFLKIWCHIPLYLCTCCDCVTKNMMTTCQQFPRLWYVSPCGLGLALLCCRANCQIVHGLPPPSLSHPDRRDFLECWCSRHKVTVALSVSVSGDQTWGISAGCYSSRLAEDAQVRGLCSPRMQASPSPCRVSTSAGWHVELFLAVVVYLWEDRRKSYAARVDIPTVVLLRAQSGRWSKDFRVL